MSFGWAYVDCSGSAGGGGASGPSGSIQFMTASGTGISSGSTSLRYDQFKQKLILTGTLDVRGAISASTFVVRQTDTLTGSTIFGNDLSDTHRFTGSVFIGTDNSTPPAFQVSLSLSQSKTSGFRVGYHSVANSAATSRQYTASTKDYVIGVSMTGAVGIRLPSAAAVGSGALYVIKDQLASRAGNSIYISASLGTGQKIDGANYYELTGTMPAISLYSNGSNWFVF